MSTAVTTLITARQNVLSLIAEITADPKPSYSIAAADGSRSISWNEYLAMLTRQATELTELLSAINPYEETTRVVI